MSRRAYLFGAVVLVAVAIVAVMVARSTDPSSISGTTNVKSASDLPVIEKGPAPSLAPGKGWLNSKPLTPADLKGKVVVYDFWTYSCVNCVRTLPYVESWYQRYAKDGLVVVGVHSPEFDFEKIHHNVAAAVKKLGVTYPVVFDDDMDIWNEFSNQYWPAKYITDTSGSLRYEHFGEGEYSATESVIRALLHIKKDAPKAVDPRKQQESLTAAITPETYLGAERGDPQSQNLNNGDQHFTLPDNIEHNRYALGGTWNVNSQYLQSTDAKETLALRYQGGEVNLVMDRLGTNVVTAVVELDGKPVPALARGASISERDGATVVDVNAADLYGLIKNGPKGDHTLTISPQAAGVQAYAFTFGS